MGLASRDEPAEHPRGDRPACGAKSRMAGRVERCMSAEPVASRPLKLLSVVIPACNEEGCISSTVEHLHLELTLRGVPHEIVVVDDGSTDRTWELITESAKKAPEVKPIRNEGLHGFGRAVAFGLAYFKG